MLDARGTALAYCSSFTLLDEAKILETCGRKCVPYNRRVGSRWTDRRPPCGSRRGANAGIPRFAGGGGRSPESRLRRCPPAAYLFVSCCAGPGGEKQGWTDGRGSSRACAGGNAWLHFPGPTCGFLFSLAWPKAARWVTAW